MSVQIHLHRTHRVHAGGLETVEVEGRTVGECLEDLARRHPGMRDALFDKHGKLSRNVEIWLNLESTYPDELARPTKDGDLLHVTVMLTGG